MKINYYLLFPLKMSCDAIYFDQNIYIYYLYIIYIYITNIIYDVIFPSENQNNLLKTQGNFVHVR